MDGKCGGMSVWGSRGAMILSAKGEGKNHYESIMYDSDI
jgi:hypothetical protein